MNANFKQPYFDMESNSLNQLVYISRQAMSEACVSTHGHVDIVLQSEFEVRNCGLCFQRGTGGYDVYRVIDERKFQIARLRHGF